MGTEIGFRIIPLQCHEGKKTLILVRGDPNAGVITMQAVPLNVPEFTGVISWEEGKQFWIGLCPQQYAVMVVLNRIVFHFTMGAVFSSNSGPTVSMDGVSPYLSFLPVADA